MSADEELVLYAVWSDSHHRYWFHTAERSVWVPPINAVVICLIAREDRNLMVNWCAKMARKHWPLQKIKKACAGKKV